MGFAAALPALGGALGGIFGGMSKPKYTDTNIYGMNQGGRNRLSNDASDQLHGIYGSDPHQFWGGKDAWTTSGGMEPAGGLSWNNLIGGGAGGRGYGGGHATGYAAHAGHSDVGLGIDDPTYAMEIPKEYEERLQSRANEIGSAQQADAWRQMQDSMTRGGTASDSPAAQANLFGLMRARLKGTSDVVRDTRNTWMSEARGLRHGWNELKTGSNIANAANDTQASIATAGNRTQASGINAGIGAGRASQRSAQEAAAAQFLVGARGADENRALERYQMLNNMNMGWQQPIGQKTPQQSGFSRVMQGIGGGMQFGGMLGGMFGGGGGGYGGKTGAGQRYDMFPGGSGYRGFSDYGL